MNQGDSNNYGNGKRSGERSRMMKMFRQGSDNTDEPTGRRSGPHQRSDSLLSDGGRRMMASPDQGSIGDLDRSIPSVRPLKPL